MKSEILPVLKNIFPALLFTLLVFVDFFQGQWEIFYGYEDLLFLLGFKSAVLVFLAVYSLKKQKYLWLILTALGLTYLLGYGVESFNPEHLRMFSKYLSPFIYFFGFKALLVSPIQFKILQQTILWIIYIALACIIFGFVFEIQGFKTYYKRFRFGYKGLFKRSIDASYFIMFSGLFAYLLKDQIKRPLILVFLITVAAFLIGTKLTLLFGFLFVISLLFTENLQNKNLFKIFTAVFILLGIIFFFISDKLKETIQLFRDIYHKEGILSSITSYRSDLLVDAYNFYSEKWSWNIYLFGGKIKNQALVEMSIPDLIIFFGIFGGMLYLFFYYQTYFRNLNLRFKYFFLLIIFCSLLGGQFFFNPTVTLWFSALILFVQKADFLKNKKLIFEEEKD